MEIIKTLVKMQKIDDVIVSLKKQVESLPKKLKNLQDALENANQVVTKKKAILDDILKAQKAIELELNSNNDLIEKYQNQLLSIKTNKEYKALNSEIALLNSKNSKLEEDELGLMENESEAKNSLAEANKSVNKAQNELEGKEDEINREIKNLESSIKAQREERNSFAKNLPPDLVRRYATLLKHKNRKAVVFNNNNACSCCGYIIRPQIQVELIDAEKILYCDNCGRILVKTFDFS